MKSSGRLEGVDWGVMVGWSWSLGVLVDSGDSSLMATVVTVLGEGGSAITSMAISVRSCRDAKLD